MIYKTLHWYVLRELLRIFLMTAGALTPLLAFCGTFKFLTKEGVDVVVLFKIMSCLMPFMLSYTIPASALFAAVLVYWRLSTDNELTACRASGISFWSILAPALVLGLAVASVDLVFVDFVAPMFIQKAERVGRRDIGSLLVSYIAKQETFVDPTKHLVVRADEAHLADSTDPHVAVIQLRGMAAAWLNRVGEPTAIICAKIADVTLREMPETDETQISVNLTEASGFDPKTFRKVSGNLDSMTPGNKPFILPSQLKDKPKFSNLFQLLKLSDQPWRFAQVRDLYNRIRIAMKQDLIAERLLAEYQKNHKVEFAQGADDRVVVQAPAAAISAERRLVFSRTPDRPVRIECFHGKDLRYVYTSDSAELQLDSDEFSGVAGSLNLRGERVLLDNLILKIYNQNVAPNTSAGVVPVVGLTISPAIAETPQFDEPSSEAERNVFWERIRREARASASPPVARLAADTNAALVNLDHTISSEMQGRGSFAVSCLTLVLFGSALGVMLRGRNPLAVFVLGFIPSILLVLLITAGRRVMESPNGHQTLGQALLWAGNVILLSLVIGTYAKLLRT